MCITPLGSSREDERCPAVEVLGDINVLSGRSALTPIGERRRGSLFEEEPLDTAILLPAASMVNALV